METLNQEFLNDLNTLNREKFLDKYYNKDIYFGSYKSNKTFEFKFTEPSDKMYILLDGENDYKVISYFNGDSHSFFYKKSDMLNNALIIKEVNPEITIEKLITALYVIYYNNEMTDELITDTDSLINAAKRALSVNYKPRPTLKFYEYNPIYKGWYDGSSVDLSITNMSKAQKARGKYNCDKAGLLIDFNLSLEDNAKLIGKTTKTLKDYCSKLGIELKTNKEILYDKIKKFCSNYEITSYKMMAKICKDNGLPITDKTLQKILSE